MLTIGRNNALSQRINTSIAEMGLVQYGPQTSLANHSVSAWHHSARLRWRAKSQNYVGGWHGDISFQNDRFVPMSVKAFVFLGGDDDGEWFQFVQPV